MTNVKQRVHELTMSALELASWILHKHPQQVTHLALQKLAFYCYGAALAFDHERQIGHISFEPWKHGPVNRAIWERCRVHGRDTIPVFALSESAPSFPRAVEDTLEDVLAVYGALDAWALREQSHLEKPWIDAYQRQDTEISTAELKAHFTSKLKAGHVTPPEYFLRAGVSTVDGIPTPRFASFRDLAVAARRLSSPI